MPCDGAEGERKSHEGLRLGDAGAGSEKDGSYLYGEQGITLDMTEFEVNGRVYAAWSQRQFHPVDQGAWLYIAELDPEKPWKLISDPVLLSMPEYGWANNHTFVDEGPFTLITDKNIPYLFQRSCGQHLCGGGPAQRRS